VPLQLLIDVILTNRSTLCQNIQNFNCGLSDVHNIISVQIKGTIPRINKKFVEYRSFKNFDQEFFLNDLEQKNLNSIVDKRDNVNSAYEIFESEFISVINKHAQMKKKKPVDKPVPFKGFYCRPEMFTFRTTCTSFNKIISDGLFFYFVHQISLFSVYFPILFIFTSIVLII
jgi:hypothetical protein